MRKALRQHNHFGEALAKARKARGLSQEDFAIESSRTYVSMLERGLKSPTLSKVEALARVIGVHPLSLLALSYLSTQADRKEALKTLVKEIERIEGSN
ncbi:MAG: helix-turn-helix transcriptional regulator [Hylemonella sp.]